MENNTITINTRHDLLPVIELLDQTEETVDAMILLIGIGASRAAEFAADEQDYDMFRRAHVIMAAVDRICADWGIAHGKG